MSGVTKSMLTEHVERLVAISGKKVTLYKNRSTYNPEWRLLTEDGTDPFFLGRGYLGRTKREAYCTIDGIIGGIFFKIYKDRH